MKVGRNAARRIGRHYPVKGLNSRINKVKDRDRSVWSVTVFICFFQTASICQLNDSDNNSQWMSPPLMHSAYPEKSNVSEAHGHQQTHGKSAHTGGGLRWFRSV